MKKYLLFVYLLWALGCKAQSLVVENESSIIETSEGKPFLWLGDTAWELFHALNKEEIIRYLDNRYDKGFTVIQAVVISELNGLETPNAYGELPLIDNDPARPNERYFQLIDFVVEETAKRDMYVAILPAWGSYVEETEGKPSLFHPENAYIYGRYLGNRYKDKAVIWILGGDRNVQTDMQYQIWQAMAKGLYDIHKGKQLMSYHPTGDISSHYWFHNDPWLSFNIVQSGHYKKPDMVYRYAGTYLQLSPTKPFLNAEPAYEDIPVYFWEYDDYAKYGKKKEDVMDERGLIKDPGYFAQGIYDDYDIRMQAYWTYLSGAAGYTYGNNAIWQMYKQGGKYSVPCITYWEEAMDRPGADDMRHVKTLFTQYPLGTFQSDLSAVFGVNLNDENHVSSVVALDHSFILVYLSKGQKVRINMSKLAKKGKAYWFDTREGVFQLIGEVDNSGILSFEPPKSNDQTGNDWLLIVDTKNNFP
ncbi:MAG: glycoside hydrolase family 140 protein [Proteiniphilum sp.]|uniref:glycoside hydrolase family 140 protein n=1 Tax=Proteiniphilum sp. TaxID=1926877 RepID=UPI002ABB2399|nr:glycoside hydrolase family 140 protein [Proteiniphilum sp.]MDY9919206.1 glycoside hydrolase family 140 protein [Proteiniphilum sp.]